MYVALHEVTWCMVVWCTQNLPRDGSSFMWHQPCQRCKYTATSVDIHKRAIKSSHSCRITCERSESARERRIALYKSNHQHHHCIMVVRLHGVHRTCAETAAVSRGTSHVTTKQRCKYTASVDIQNVIRSESHATKPQ